MGTIFDSIRLFVLTHLPHDRCDPATVAALEAQSIPHLLITWLNWRSRWIEPHPRTVLRSPQFDANPITRSKADEIELLIEEIERGDDLSRRLSKAVRIGFTLPKKGKAKPLGPRNRPDLDMLLNDWRVHHLHIGKNEDEEGFIERGGLALFAVFRMDEAYLINIYDHNSWGMKEVIEISVRSWPNAELFLDLKSISPSRGDGCSDAERLQLRNHGFVTFAEVDGKVYVGTGGISNAGYSVRINRTASQIMRTIDIFEREVALDDSRVRHLCTSHGIVLPGEPIFDFAFFGNEFGVIERASQAAIQLGYGG